MRRRTSGSAALFVVLAGFAAPAQAQDVAAAEALFDRGMAAMEAGDYAKACPAIGESHRLDPRAGTLFTLAECEFRRGRIATAFARYGDYLALFDTLSPEKRKRQEAQGRDKAARDQRKALPPQIPELTLILGASVPRGAVVKRDDVVLAEPSLGIALPVDPGEHVIALEIPGKPAIERRVTLAVREKKTIVLEAVEPPKEVPPPPPVKPPPPPVLAPVKPPPVKPPPPSKPQSGTSSQKIAGYAIGGAGVAGLAVGAVLGGLTFAKKGTLGAECGSGEVPACSPAGIDAFHAARAFSTGSTVAFIAGGALAATGVILIVTDKRRPVTVGVTPAGAALQGRF